MKKWICAILLLLFFFFPTISHAAGIYTTEKLITVDLYKQTLFVWEGGRMINKTRVSTGLPATPTVRGSFRTYYKIPSQTMRGGSRAYGRYLYKKVPNVMYFYQGYAIHGAYWHNSFGWPASHGCVNVPLTFAQWLYAWAPLGTRVEVF